MKQRGFTLVEVLIVLCIVVITFVLIFGAYPGCNKTTNKTLEDARDFAKNLGEDVTNIACVNRDTDNDGYVTCTIFRKDKDPLSIECARGWTMNSGCKLPKYRYNQLGR